VSRARKAIRTLRSRGLAAAAILALLAGCHAAGPDASDAQRAPAPAAVVMAVDAARVTVEPISSEIRLLGTTVALRHFTLRAPAAGRVLGLNLQNGDRVRRGEVVAQVVNREVEAAESGLAVAQRIDPAEAPALAQAVKRYNTRTGIAVVAPEDAVVAQRIVSNGQIVADLDLLADLIDPRSVYVEAAVPIGDIAAITPGMKARVTSAIKPGADFPAHVTALSPSFSPGGAIAPARVEFSGADRIERAGAPVEILVTSAYVPSATVIPATALFQDAAIGGWYVFVAGADGRAHRTPITVGIRAQDRAQVTAGVAPGQLVITSGGYALSDGLKVKAAVAQN
jgi:multidrug efflux pump subunit AcrA (membrane-fusion protein)